MNLDQMIKDLKAEAEALDSAIVVLQRLALNQKRRRGRPPAWMQVSNELEESPAPRRTGRKRAPLSEETKKRMAESQRKRWAAARKER